MSERYCDPHKCPVWSWTHSRVGRVGGGWAQEVSCGNASQHTSKDQWNWLVFCFFMMLSMTLGHTTQTQNWWSNIWTKLSMCESRAPSVDKRGEVRRQVPQKTRHSFSCPELLTGPAWLWSRGTWKMNTLHSGTKSTVTSIQISFSNHWGAIWQPSVGYDNLKITSHMRPDERVTSTRNAEV
jgi:hypothetical protein